MTVIGYVSLDADGLPHQPVAYKYGSVKRRKPVVAYKTAALAIQYSPVKKCAEVTMGEPQE